DLAQGTPRFRKGRKQVGPPSAGRFLPGDLGATFATFALNLHVGSTSSNHDHADSGLVRARAQASLAAVHPDEDVRSAVARGADRGNADFPRRWARTRRRNRIVVDRVPRLQSPAYSTDGRETTRRVAPRDAGWARPRTGASAGDAPRGFAARRS